MLLLATMMLSVPLVASAAVPSDPRITAAVEAWRSDPLYVDPDFAAVADQPAMREKVRSAKVPVFVAVLPTGEWFQEKGDAELLAGWLANAHNKPGLYVVMDQYTTYGAEHELAASAAGRTWGRDSKQSMSSRLGEYLDAVRVGDRYDAGPARTTPYEPRPETPSEPERFTVGKAIGSGVGGLVMGLLGGLLLAGVVLGVSALTVRRRGGRS